MQWRLRLTCGIASNIVRFGLMVGIGGVPQDGYDIRLGDFVVNQPGKANKGVVQYDFGRTISGGQFVQTGVLDGPPNVLLTATGYIESRTSTAWRQSNFRMSPSHAGEISSRVSFRLSMSRE